MTEIFNPRFYPSSGFTAEQILASREYLLNALTEDGAPINPEDYRTSDYFEFFKNKRLCKKCNKIKSLHQYLYEGKLYQTCKKCNEYNNLYTMLKTLVNSEKNQ